MPRIQLPIKLIITVLVVGMLMLTSAVLTWVSNKTLTDQAMASGAELFDRIVAATAEGVQAEIKTARVAAQVLVNLPLTGVMSLNERERYTASLLSAVKSQDSMSSAFVGTRAGSFLQVRLLNTEQAQQQLDAPADAQHMARLIARDTPGVLDAVRYFYDAKGGLVEARAVKDDFDPRERPWYKDALAAPAGAEALTPPYVFQSTREVGMTIAARREDGQAVIGLDITLHSLSKLLGDFGRNKGVTLVLFNDQGEVVAHPEIVDIARPDGNGQLRLAKLDELGSPMMNTVWGQFRNPGSASLARKSDRGDLARALVGSREYFVRTGKIFDHGDFVLYLGALTPVDELVAPAIAARNRAILITLVAVVLLALASLRIAEHVAKPIRDLTREARAISRFHFETPPRRPNAILEVTRLGNTIDSLRDTILRFLKISNALGAEGNFEKLLDRILMETINAAGATGGGVLLLSADGSAFDGGAIFLPHAPGLRVSDLDADLRLVARAPVLSSCIRDKTVKTHRLESASPATTAGERQLLGMIKATGCDTAALPLLDRKGDVLGVLNLYWADTADGKASLADDDRLAFVEALSGTASVALANQQLISQQKGLLQSFIELIAGAIDSKSPYTAGHCQRVPELTKMLARAAQAQSQGPYADFRLSEDEWEELHIAAWMHDCGKVTTPEFVVDKATKLETVYDRIHEVRMRFELVKAQAQVETWKQAVERVREGRDTADLFEALQARLQALDEDWAFVAQCNEGGGFMAPQKIERLRAIAQTPWLRTLDDRIGISHDELARKQQAPAAPLPAVERLLDDKPEHIIARPERERLKPDTAPGNPWGFALNMPEHLYNRGEVYNLSISRGTLTDEDRYKINDHIVQTIKMLSALPFPKHLRRVPDIAGAHHEKMDGGGYPKRLNREQMGETARMMAIADIFEALTADDRPYKKGKLLSEAIKIMCFMVRDRHIDPDLFELFLRSNIHIEYAQRFMRPSQIDAVDVDASLQLARPATPKPVAAAPA